MLFVSKRDKKSLSFILGILLLNVFVGVFFLFDSEFFRDNILVSILTDITYIIVMVHMYLYLSNIKRVKINRSSIFLIVIGHIFSVIIENIDEIEILQGNYLMILGGVIGLLSLFGLVMFSLNLIKVDGFIRSHINIQIMGFSNLLIFPIILLLSFLDLDMSDRILGVTLFSMVPNLSYLNFYIGEIKSL